MTEGKVRAVALSKVSPQAIDEWFRRRAGEPLRQPVALQPQYSLVASQYRQELTGAAERHGMSVFPYRVLDGGSSVADTAPILTPRVAPAAGR